MKEGSQLSNKLIIQFGWVGHTYISGDEGLSFDPYLVDILLYLSYHHQHFDQCISLKVFIEESAIISSTMGPGSFVRWINLIGANLLLGT